MRPFPVFIVLDERLAWHLPRCQSAGVRPLSTKRRVLVNFEAIGTAHGRLAGERPGN
jgi:hypothetical protein